MIYTLSANAQGYKSDSANCCLFTFTPTHEKVEKVNKQKEYKKNDLLEKAQEVQDICNQCTGAWRMQHICWRSNDDRLLFQHRQERRG